MLCSGRQAPSPSQEQMAAGEEQDEQQHSVDVGHCEGQDEQQQGEDVGHEVTLNGVG